MIRMHNIYPCKNTFQFSDAWDVWQCLDLLFSTEGAAVLLGLDTSGRTEKHPTRQLLYVQEVVTHLM